MPGISSIGSKDQLVNNFMASIKKLKDKNVSQECIVYIKFMCVRLMPLSSHLHID